MTLKLLYGVQATGQGHITRARSLGPALLQRDIKVDFLFSGRPREKLFAMEQFGAFTVRRGLTFHFNKGQISPYLTILRNNILEAINDINNLDLSGYDLVLTDYEPISSWAARLKGTPSIGIGHQYAFCHDIPMQGFSKLTLAAMRHFAPANTSLGIHWHNFGKPIIPPMVPLPDTTKSVIPKKIVVYLYFEDQARLAKILQKFPDYEFFIYSPENQSEQDNDNLHFRPASQKFMRDVEDCEGVICGAGFELPTEVIHLGKKLLVKAMGGQPEQASNALAIEKLGLGTVMTTVDENSIRNWLNSGKTRQIIFPDTAHDVAQWIAEGDWGNCESLVKKLWQKTIG